MYFLVFCLLKGALDTNYKAGIAWFESVVMLQKFTQLFCIWWFQDLPTVQMICLVVSGASFGIFVYRVDPFATRYTSLYTPCCGYLNLKYSYVLPCFMVGCSALVFCKLPGCKLITLITVKSLITLLPQIPIPSAAPTISITIGPELTRAVHRPPLRQLL